MRDQHVLRAVLAPWAIEPQMYQAILEIVGRHMVGERLDAEVIRAHVAAGPGTGQEVTMRQGVAVVPVSGVLAHRINLLSDISGGTSTERLSAQLHDLDRDPSVGSIVLDIDSPGGEVFGMTEIASQIRSLSTPVVAQANDVAASAAYWIASAADEIVVTPSGMVGSIGVLAGHRDESVANEQAGVKYTIVSAGEGKADGHASGPLSDRAHADLKDKVNAFYSQFVHDVVTGRNAAAASADGRTRQSQRQITADTVRHRWEARMMTASQALDQGLVDRIGTLDETVGRLMQGHQQRRRLGALARRARAAQAGVVYS